MLIIDVRYVQDKPHISTSYFVILYTFIKSFICFQLLFLQATKLSDSAMYTSNFKILSITFWSSLMDWQLLNKKSPWTPSLILCDKQILIKSQLFQNIRCIGQSCIIIKYCLQIYSSPIVDSYISLHILLFHIQSENVRLSWIHCYTIWSI